jgi:hypothetical protein
MPQLFLRIFLSIPTCSNRATTPHQQPVARSTKPHMPLQALPTELDIRIVEYLATRDASRLSRTSKYYRRVAEPIFYKDVVFTNRQDDLIKRFLIILLDRDDMRLHVESLTLYDSGPSRTFETRGVIEFASDPSGGRVYEELWKSLHKVQNIVNNLADRYRFHP